MTEDAEIAESTAARVAARVRKLQKELKEERDDEQQEQTRNDLYDALAEMLLDVSNIRRAFGNTIIRRELDSVGEHGKGTITGMKPFWHQKAYLELSDVERAHIAKIEELVSRDLDIREDIDSINLLFESSVCPSVCHSSLFADCTVDQIYANVTQIIGILSTTKTSKHQFSLYLCLTIGRKTTTCLHINCRL